VVYTNSSNAPTAATYSRPINKFAAVNPSNESTVRSGTDANNSAAASSQNKKNAALAETLQIEKLKSRDREVKAHEMAHAAAGGALAGAPKFNYTTGPDGKRYAISGEVSIDTSLGRTPEETLEKARVIQAAANAPAEPSAQDRRVAQQAAQMAQQARAELLSEQNEESNALSDSTDSEDSESVGQVNSGDVDGSSAEQEANFFGSGSEDEEADRIAGSDDGSESDRADSQPAFLDENRRSAAEIFEEIYGTIGENDELTQRLIDLGINDEEESPLAAIVDITV
jgi:hypothetical protein